jgi:predicted MPP superfamily phosphohydrolase
MHTQRLPSLSTRFSCSRRRFLTLAGAAALSISPVRVLGQMFEALDTHALEIHEVTVRAPQLPSLLEGLTIAQISDTHLRGLGLLEEQVVAAIRTRDPAVVVLTGDMLSSNMTVRTGGAVLTEFCRALTASHRRVFAVRGNHEVLTRIPVPTLQRLYREVGVELLVNEHRVLESGLTIVGAEDSVTRHYNLRAAVRHMPASPVRLLLSHAPEVFDWPEQLAFSFTLCLAGHTHGGQIRLPFLPPYVPQGAGPRFVSGWYAQTQLGPAYVSRGIGTTLIPVRFNCPPELPFFRLTRA